MRTDRHTDRQTERNTDKRTGRHRYSQTGVTKLIFGFRNFAKAANYLKEVHVVIDDPLDVTQLKSN